MSVVEELGMSKPKIAIVGSHNFPGGTSTAIAEELSVLVQMGDVSFYNADVKMLRNNPINQTLFRSLREHGVPIKRATGIISADIAIVHNPALFKFEDELPFRVLSRKVFVIMHENPINAFSRPNFNYQKTLGLLHRATVTPEFLLAPISGVSRMLIQQSGVRYNVAETDWFNIWSRDDIEPTRNPQDRRGRHSRPGLGKWPNVIDFAKCFPTHAENHILGATSTMMSNSWANSNTHLYDFGSMQVPKFLEKIDFMVYFHSDALRESFGRTIVEAISAGKVVITHPYMEQTFGDACVYASADEVDQIVAHYIANSDLYVDKVKQSQKTLRDNYSPQAFLREWGGKLAAA